MGMTYQGPDRRQTPDIRAELIAVASGLESMASAVETNLSETRLTNIVANEQRRDRWKIVTPILVGIALVLFISFSNHQQNNDVSTVAGYVRHCLQHPEKLSAAKKAAECGNTSSGQAFFVTYLNCALQKEVPQRTDAYLNSCVQKGVAATGGK
jgi:hypothetical protein